MVREPRFEDPGQTIVLSVSAAFWRKLQRGVDQCFFEKGKNEPRERRHDFFSWLPVCSLIPLVRRQGFRQFFSEKSHSKN